MMNDKILTTQSILKCDEIKVKELISKFFSCVLTKDTEEAKKLISPNTTIIGTSGTISMKELISLLQVDNNGYSCFIPHYEEMECLRLKDSLFNLIVPLTVIEGEIGTFLITTTFTVDIEQEEILFLSIPLQDLKNTTKDYIIGQMSFYLGPNYKITLIDDLVAHFLKYKNGLDMKKALDSNILNALKEGDKEEFIELLNSNKDSYLPVLNKVSLLNKNGKGIDVSIEMNIIKVKSTIYKVIATVHDLMRDEDENVLNGRRFYRLINILNSSPTPFFIKNLKGEYVGTNKSYLKSLGLDETYNIIGKTDYDYLSKELADLFTREDDIIIRTKKPLSKFAEDVDSNGDPKNFQYTKAPLIENGKVVGLICFILDVSIVTNLNKELLKSQLELGFIFNNSKISYYIKDTNFRFRRVNKTFLRQNDVTEEEIIGKTSEEIFEEKQKGSMVSFTSQERDIVKTKKPFYMSQYLIDTSGKKRYFSLSESPLLDDDGSVIGIVGAVEDITVAVERHLRLVERYQNVMKVISDDNFQLFMKIDIDTGIIEEYKAVDSTHNYENSQYNEDFINAVSKIFVYDNDKKNFLETFSFRNLKASFSPEGRFSREYTYSRIKGKLGVATVDGSYSVNPSNNHKELFIYAFDITTKSHLNELIASITQTGYDFIVKANLQVDRCEFVVYDKDIYDIPKDENFTVSKFLDLCFEKALAPILSAEEAIESAKECLMSKDEFSFTIDTIDGRRKSIVVRPLNRERDTYLIIQTDITDITMKDSELQKKLKQSIIDSERANNIKSDFLARMSHDMRTPLNGIMGLADFGVAEAENPEIEEYFRKIKMSSNYLLTLLNDVLDMQSIERGKIRIFPKAISIKKTIKEVETIVIPRAKEKDITLNIVYPDNTPKYINNDPVRISQVLVNILSNAIKYTPNGGTVNFFNELIDYDQSTYKIVIQDNGVGMSKKFQERMFDSFTTETNVLSPIEGGTGLGLAISNSIVRLMGGHIECKSELGVGTTFTIFLPIDPISAKRYKEMNESQEQVDFTKMKKKKVLICEDNAINIMILKKILEDKGLIVDTAANGEIGAKKVKENKYDFIFMDIKMPVMDGLTAAKEIRTFNTEVPIIALSANAYKEDVEKSIESGMNAHLSKPIDRNDLFKTLSKYLPK